MKRILLSLLILLGMMQSLACAEENFITISVYDACNINGPDVLLGEIAQISGADNGRIEELRKVKVANAATPGNELVLTSELFGIRISAANVDLSGIAWNIPPNITVRTNSQTIAGAALVEVAKDFVFGQLDLSKASRTFAVEAASTPKDCVVPLGNIRYKVELSYGVRYNAPTNVNVLIYLDDALYTKAMFRMDVTMQEPVVMTTRSMMKNELITAGDVHLVTVDTSRLPAGYLTDLNAAIGLVVKRNINMGVPLAKSLLAREIIIKRSDIIDIVSKVNGVEIIVQGIAMQNGREGDKIRVKNTLSNRIVAGKVLDEKTVQVGTR